VFTEVADNNQVLQLTIHRTDKLRSNLYIAHPVVRVHIINLDTGYCVKKQKKCVANVPTVSLSFCKFYVVFIHPVTKPLGMQASIFGACPKLG